MTPDELYYLLFADDEGRRANLTADNRLVHYTSAEAAYKILVGKQVWLRSAAVMNDFSEIEHGKSCLIGAWLSEPGKRLREFLDLCENGLSDQIAKVFDGHSPNFRHDTYIMSLSEHDRAEDEYGRLSMWRAYGGKAGIALVLNTQAFHSESDALKVYSAPVHYEDVPQFGERFSRIVETVLTKAEEVKGLGSETIYAMFFTLFRILTLCTKHPGFKEEREWRIFTSPTFEGESPWLRYDIEVIGGVPQAIAKLELFDDPEHDISGLSADSLISRVIIGPCESPLQVRSAMQRALVEAECSNPEERLWMSLIPLRQGC